METARKYRALDGGPEKFTTVRCSVPVRNVFVHASHADQRCARRRRVCRYNVAFVCTFFLHMGGKRRFCVHRGKTQLLRALFFGELRISRGNAAFACTCFWRNACTNASILRFIGENTAFACTGGKRGFCVHGFSANCGFRAKTQLLRAQVFGGMRAQTHPFWCASPRRDS